MQCFCADFSGVRFSEGVFEMITERREEAFSLFLLGRVEGLENQPWAEDRFMAEIGMEYAEPVINPEM